MSAPRRQNLATALGRHSGTKAVTAFAHQFARLVGPFHGIVSAARSTSGRSPIGHANEGARLARLIREPFRLVNATWLPLAGFGRAAIERRIDVKSHSLHGFPKCRIPMYLSICDRIETSGTGMPHLAVKTSRPFS
jgi:hypothetical protein